MRRCLINGGIHSLAIAVASAAISLAGCGPRAGGDGSSQTGAAPNPPTPAAREIWPYWPVRMRIHPLTRLSRDSDGPVIDLRLEFFDDGGDTTRCSGEAIIELVALPEDPASTAAVVAMQWNLDLRDLQLNRTHFDDITRTYLIRLRPGEGDVPPRGEVRATFNSANGVVLRASLPLQ